MFQAECESAVGLNEQSLPAEAARRGFVFEDTRPTMTNDELLADLRRVASQLGLSAVPQRSYRPLGQYSTSTFKKRFGSWNAAARAAGLRPTTEINLPDDELLRNLEEVWVSLGRQPRKKDMVRPASRFTREPYIRRYGGLGQCDSRVPEGCRGRRSYGFDIVERCAGTRSAAPVPSPPLSGPQTGSLLVSQLRRVAGQESFG